MTQLRLTCDDASTFKNAVRVFTLDGAMVGHVAAEHVKLVSLQTIIMYLYYRIEYSVCHQRPRVIIV